MTTIKSASEITSDDYIHTQGGRFVLAKPKWDIRWMAHSLAQKARFGGHADERYSVAEHSVLVSILMQELYGGNPLEGLLHEAGESVLPDVNSPWKKYFPDLRAAETALETDFRKKWNLPAEKSQACRKADWIALFMEAAQILPERGMDFDDPYNLRPEALKLREKGGWRIACLDWREAKEAFLERYTQLNGYRYAE